MIPSNAFQTFYEGYLGLNNAARCNGVSVGVSPYRDQPINKHYFYKLIATNYHGSVSSPALRTFSRRKPFGSAKTWILTESGTIFCPASFPGESMSSPACTGCCWRPQGSRNNGMRQRHRTRRTEQGHRNGGTEQGCKNNRPGRICCGKFACRTEGR